MKKILLIFLLMFIVGCTDTNNKEEKIEKNNVTETTNQNIEENEEEIKKFWEVYSEEEIKEALKIGGEGIEINYEVAPLFEEVLINALENDDTEKDWHVYLTVFYQKSGEEAPEGYAMELYQADRALIDGDKEKAIEHIEKAIEIRESD